MLVRSLGVLFLVLSIGAAGAVFNEPVYVDTQGTIITERGSFCAPEEKLSNGTIRVYRKSASDLAMLEERMEAAGLSAEDRARIILAADSNECARKSAKECSKGTCSSGSCKQKFTGNFTSCSCQ